MKRKSQRGVPRDVPTYQLKIVLSGLRPPIWRRVLVRGDIPLGLLHAVVQVAMGWTNNHLHQFVAGERYYSDPAFGLEDYFGEPQTLDENQVTLRQVAPHQKDAFLYEYDFGDSWQHAIRVEKILAQNRPATAFAECTGGARACPPEDCGGVFGYEELLETLQHPRRKEYPELIDWLGGSFDPEAFDLDRVNKYLRLLKWPRATIPQLARVLMQRDRIRG
jgi:hypothetical protein